MQANERTNRIGFKVHGTKIVLLLSLLVFFFFIGEKIPVSNKKQSDEDYCKRTGKRNRSVMPGVFVLYKECKHLKINVLRRK